MTPPYPYALTSSDGEHQANRHAAGELTGPAVTITDRVTGRSEQVHAGDRIRFIRPYLDRGTEWRYVANGTGGQVLAVDADAGLVTVGCDDGRTVTLQPAALEEAQPLRLGYAGHALKLQGGQAAVVLVLPGGWQTSRQSATRWPPAAWRSSTSSSTPRRSRPALTAAVTRFRRWVPGG